MTTFCEFSAKQLIYNIDKKNNQFRTANTDWEWVSSLNEQSPFE